MKLLEIICEHGGIRVNSGLDDNRDGILQSEEIDDFSFICQPCQILKLNRMK